ncbi:MAG: efflux RND transporter periplasmic adaptor subunit [bacterium]
MKKSIIILFVLGAIGLGGWQGWSRWKPKKQEAQWRTRKIERGEIVQEVRATGTVKPIKNILVGTQVNGPIKKLYVDFNDEVKVGQQIAQIDDAVYQATVSKDEATLSSAKANVLSAKSNNAQARATVELTQTKLALAEKELTRMKQLRETEMVAQADLDTALSNRDALVAQVKVNEAAVAQTESAIKQTEAMIQQGAAFLQLSRANLGYTTIKSPVDGVIIQRNVDEGQTVVSSMNAQTIFTIATDLNRIQIQADIPESDIGGIEAGQRVTFSVDAYNRVVFTGSVVQVRMSATSVQNVVTFPVIIEADNPNKRLFPGMTANLAVETGRAEQVLKVPAAALRFTPVDLAQSNDEDKGTRKKGAGAAVWLLDKDNKPERIKVKQKISDGTMVGVESEQELSGREVIIGTQTASSASTEKETNPFAPKMPSHSVRHAAR